MASFGTWSSFTANIALNSQSTAFKVLTLQDCITRGIAQEAWCEDDDQGISFWKIVTPSGGVSLDATSVKWYATGDACLPVNCAQAGYQQPNNQISSSPASGDPLVFKVLFVKNDPLYMIPINALDWNWTWDDKGSGNPQDLSVFYIPNRTSYQGKATVLGDAISNYNATLPNDRVIAAVLNPYVVQLNTVYPGVTISQTVDASYEIGNNQGRAPNGQVNFGSHHSIQYCARTTPYTNFMTCADSCNNQWGFFDVIEPAQVAQCCATGGQGKLNCGPFGDPTTNKSACLSWMDRFAGDNIADPNVQAYIHSQPGQLDALMSTLCQQSQNQMLPICACSIPPVFDPSIPPALQQTLAANPQCTSFQCVQAGYKNANLQNAPCSINFLQCLQNQTVQNNQGQFNNSVKLQSSNQCQQMVQQYTGAAPGAGPSAGPSTTVTNTKNAAPASPGAMNPPLPTGGGTTTIAGHTISSSSLRIGLYILIGVVVLIILLAVIRGGRRR